MWLPPQSGRTAAEFPMEIHGGGSISPYLLQPRNQWAELIEKMAPALKEYLNRRKNDEIANSLLASENARRAEPVMNNGQYVSGGPGMDAAGVADHNASLGYTGTYDAPQLGGTYALFLARQQKAMDDQRQEDAMKGSDWEQMHRMRELQMWKMTQPDDNRVPRYKRTLSDGSVVEVTGGEALRADRPPPNPWAGTSPVARGKLDEVTGEFTNAYTGAENGPMIQLHTPSGKMLVLPNSEYERSLQQWQQRSLGSGLYQQRLQDGQTQAVTPNNATGSPPATVPSPSVATAPPKGKVRVKRPDGQIGLIPAEQLQSALAQGYQRVQ
jgi:hypothetical protein